MLPRWSRDLPDPVTEPPRDGRNRVTWARVGAYRWQPGAEEVPHELQMARSADGDAGAFDEVFRRYAPRACTSHRASRMAHPVLVDDARAPFELTTSRFTTGSLRWMRRAMRLRCEGGFCARQLT